MENKIVSTTYAPLQPPYLIIKYGEQVAIQIGTLIITQQIEGDSKQRFRIETHSYPVVSYNNKANPDFTQRQLFEYDFMEGVVWNKVELRDVSAICRTDAHLPWEEFIDFIWSDLWRKYGTGKPAILTYRALSAFGVKIDPPKFKSYTLHIQTYTNMNMSGCMVRTSREDVLALNVRLCDDNLKMYRELIMQVSSYNINFALNPAVGKGKNIQVKYTTDEKMLEPLVELLNNDKPFKPITPNDIELLSQINNLDLKDTEALAKKAALKKKE